MNITAKALAIFAMLYILYIVREASK